MVEYVQLLSRECCRSLMESESISTITIYEGENNCAAVFLRERLEQIIIANPWLTGRLVSRNGNARNNPHILRVLVDLSFH